MRLLNDRERGQVSGAGVVVEVNTPAKYVKVTLTAFFGLIKIPVANVNWSRRP